jgi:DNA-3-methyladenine glycosylase
MESTKVILPQSFYLSNEVVFLAKALLGKEIATKIDGVTTAGIIVETEAYCGPEDRGSHAFGGRYTERTKTMYAEGGVAYVYICYGMHPMMNIVTGKAGNAHAVLIRAIEPTSGIDIMAQRRKLITTKPILTNGPAKAAVALGITKEMNGSELLSEGNPIVIRDLNFEINDSDIVSGPRVGMSKHVAEYSNIPWRFYIKNNPWVSKPLNIIYPW